jgi:hypothetical protein
VTETSNPALTSNALQSVELWSKSVGNEQFTRGAGTIYSPYLAWFWSGGIESSLLWVSPHILQAVEVWLNSVGNKRHFTRDTKGFIVHMSPRVGAVGPKRHSYHSPRMPYKQYKFGPNRLVMKGILLETPKKFFAHISSAFGAV